jgi:hypothetical protein
MKQINLPDTNLAIQAGKLKQLKLQTKSIAASKTMRELYAASKAEALSLWKFYAVRKAICTLVWKQMYPSIPPPGRIGQFIRREAPYGRLNLP